MRSFPVDLVMVNIWTNWCPAAHSVAEHAARNMPTRAIVEAMIQEDATRSRALSVRPTVSIELEWSRRVARQHLGAWNMQISGADTTLEIYASL